MNDLNSRSIPHQGQFIGQFRRVDKADWETVCENGKPALYPSAWQAECQAWRVLRKHMGEVFGYRGESVSPRERAERELMKVWRNGEGGAEAQDGREAISGDWGASSP